MPHVHYYVQLPTVTVQYVLRGKSVFVVSHSFFISIEASDPLERGSDDRPIGFWLFDHLVFVTTSSLHVHIEEPSNILHVAILVGSDSHHTL